MDAVGPWAASASAMLSLTMNATSWARQDGEQRLGQPGRLVLIQALHAELDRRHRPGLERAFEPGRELPADLGRARSDKAWPMGAAEPIGPSPHCPRHERPSLYPCCCPGADRLFRVDLQALARAVLSGKAPRQALSEFYAAEFDTVEINNSFYRLPKAETFDAWREQAPSGFCYAVKANRFLTQAKKLKDCEEPLARCYAPSGTSSLRSDRCCSSRRRVSR